MSPSYGPLTINGKSRFPKVYKGIRLIDGAGPCISNVRRIDHFAMPMISRMMATGLQVDLDHFKKMEVDLTQDMEKAVEDIRSLTGYYVNPGSGDQVADLLFKKLKLKQAKAKMTASGDRESVEDAVLTAIQHLHPVVPKIQEYKEFEKLKGTYVLPMAKLAVKVGPNEWRMFPNIKHTRVPSGRLSCSDPNLLAIPSRTERGRDIRKGFITKTGWKVCSIDEASIEPRIAAHRSKDPALLGIFRDEQDLYSDFAIFANKLPDKRFRNAKGVWEYPGVDKMKHRRACKICVLAAIYDVTAMGLQEQMPIICGNCEKEATLHTCGKFRTLWTEPKCQELLNSFYTRYPGLMRMRKADHAYMRRNTYMVDMWGRMLHSQAVRSVLEWVVSAALREGANHPMQCLSGWSKVFVRNLGLRSLHDLSGEHTLWDGSTWATGRIVETGVKQSVIVTLHNGLRLKCSPDHQILTASPTGLRKWVKAGDLKVSNRSLRVCIPESKMDNWDWADREEDCTRNEHYTNVCSIKWWTEDPQLFGEMLGRIASDGSLIRSKREANAPKDVCLIVAEHEKSIISRLLEAVERTAPRHRLTTACKGGKYKPVHRIEIGSRGLTELFLKWGLKDRIPDIAWSNSEVLKGYLRGMFDGDGTVCHLNNPRGGGVYLTFGSKNSRLGLARDIQHALLLLGIRSRLRMYPYRIQLHIQQKDIFWFHKLIGFINPVKTAKLEKAVSYKEEDAAYGRAVSVRSIETGDQESMYDFVDSSTGRFLADGVVVHNSSSAGTLKITLAAVNDDFEKCGDGIWDTCNFLLPVHDEILFECREDLADEFTQMIKWRFETLFTCLDVDVRASGAKADSWGLLDK